MKRKSFAVLASIASVAVSAGWVSACSSTAHECDAQAERAREKVGAVIEAHRACQSDADCLTVGFSATCFDSCTRAINAAGVPELNAAIKSVDAEECADFTAGGCKFPVPPCAPPLPPSCTAGVCE